MAKQENAEKLPRFAFRARDQGKLLDTYTPDEPNRRKLKQFIRDIQSELHAGLPLRGRPTAAERKSALDDLKDLEKALRTATRLLSARADPTKRAVGRLLATELARSLTDDAFRLAGLPVIAPSSREREISRARAREPELDIAEGLRRQREAFARQSGAVLAALLGRCLALIAAQLAVERQNRGGRPSVALREYVLVRLAFVFDEVFGVPPTPGETSTFVKLATDVLQLFELETAGIEAAARRVLGKLRPQRRSRSEPGE